MPEDWQERAIDTKHRTAVATEPLRRILRDQFAQRHPRERDNLVIGLRVRGRQQPAEHIVAPVHQFCEGRY